MFADLPWDLPWAAHAEDGPYIVQLLVVGIVLLLGALSVRGQAWAVAAKAGLWFGLILAVALGYGFRHELRDAGERALAIIVPSHGYRADADSVSFPVASDGHYWVNARVNGLSFRFMVDTGASSVVFGKDDARRLGFDAAGLRFDRTVSTANGLARAATIRLRELTIGPITVANLPALVNEGELSSPLLGMRALERLSSVEISNGTLTLRR